MTPAPTVEDAEDKMLAALKLAADFCLANSLDAAHRTLQRCLMMSEERNDEMLGVPDICPEGYDPRARALLAAALRVVIVLNSSVWNVEAVSEAERPEFSCNTLRMWHASMLGLEAASAIAAIPVGRSNNPEHRHSAPPQ
jgi:hypothetical protein